MENRIKILENELNIIQKRKDELNNILGDIYVNYDEDELKEDISRFEKSHEVKSGKIRRNEKKVSVCV
jgi:hypothetical protein